MLALARDELHLQVDHLGAEAAAGELEGHTRARRRFGEQVADGEPGERAVDGGASPSRRT
jgi:hypothetical protein